MTPVHITYFLIINLFKAGDINDSTGQFKAIRNKKQTDFQSVFVVPDFSSFNSVFLNGSIPKL